MRTLEENVTPPPTEDELLARLSGPIKNLLDGEIADDNPDKTYQYSNARRNYLMFRGLQFLAPTSTGGGWDWGSVGGMSYGQGGNTGGGGGSFNYTRNIFRSGGNKFIAAVGQRAPNVIAEADDPGDESSVRGERAANDCNQILNSWWDIDQRQIETCTILWTTGPAYIYTPWNADGELYGYREEPQIEMQQQPMGPPQFRCMNCGNVQDQPGTCQKCGAQIRSVDALPQEMVEVPVTVGTTKYPNGRVECYVVDCTMVTTPFYAKNDLRMCPWLRYEYEENKGKLLSMFPQLRQKMSDSDSSDGGDSYGKFTRASIASPIGTPSGNLSKSRWMYSRVWLQPDQFELLKDEELRKLAKESYPTGLKVTRVQGQIVKLEEEKLDEVWSSIQPSASQTLNADPLGQDLISTQLLTNDMLNINAETFERAIPLTIVDPRVFNTQVWNQQRSQPAQMMPALPAVGASLRESFVDLPAARVSDQLNPWMAGLEASAMQDVGITPQLYGVGTASTAREAEINKNAAIMQFGIVWTYIRKGWERAKRNGVLQLVKYGAATIREGKYTVELSQLTGGAWHFVADEAIPQSWGQQRDLMMFLMEKPPAVLQSFGYTDPANIPQVCSWLGLSNWNFPGLNDREKTLDTIQKLLQAAPIQQPGPNNQVQMMPSIPADDFEDDPAMVVKLVQDWAQSLAGRKERETNPNGYSNVIAWGKAYRALANPAPPPPPPPEPKLSFSGKLNELPPEVATSVLKEFNVPLPAPPPQQAQQQLPPVTQTIQ